MVEVERGHSVAERFLGLEEAVVPSLRLGPGLGLRRSGRTAAGHQQRQLLANPQCSVKRKFALSK